MCHCHVCQNQVVESFHHLWHSFYPVIQSPRATCFSTPSGRVQGKLEPGQLGRGGRVAIDRILLIFQVLWACAACPCGRKRRRWMLLRWNCVLSGRDVVCKDYPWSKMAGVKEWCDLFHCVLPEPLVPVSVETEGKKAEINTDGVWGHSVCPANPLPVPWAQWWGGQGWGKLELPGNEGLGSREEMVAVPWTAKGSSSSTTGAERRERF